jgi:RNA polymerase sigma-70 factor (ECF subfamily)
MEAARLEAARAAWPDVHVESERFRVWVAARLEAGESPAQLHLEDLYLACACAHGDPAALMAFERRFLVDVPRWLARLGTTPALCDEVRQQLRERLLTGDRPRIATYSGRGALSSWLHVATIRIAVNLQRGDRAARLVGDAPLADPDPELRLLQRRYKEDFRQAFAGAVAALGMAERRLLRMHFLDGVPLGQIGALHGVDKSTVSRRLAAARQALFAQTRRHLQARLRLSETEFASLMRVVRSQFHDVSIMRLLDGG